jgi:hypothetical protein
MTRSNSRGRAGQVQHGAGAGLGDVLAGSAVSHSQCSEPLVRKLFEERWLRE